MESASNHRGTELAEDESMSARAMAELPEVARVKLGNHLAAFSRLTERALEKIAACTRLDAAGGNDDGVAGDRIVHGATIGSLAVIALSSVVLIYGWAGAALGLRSHDRSAIVSTTEGAVPSWNSAAQSSAEQQLAIERAAWSPSITDNIAEPEPAEATSGASPTQTPANEERSMAIKLYDQHATHYTNGEYSKLWNAVDPTCIFIDAKGKRSTAKELRPLSQQFFSSIRNARVKYKIHNVMMSDDTIVAHVESDLRFELRSELLFLENWSPHVKTEVTIDTWKKRENTWKIVESRTLRPELLRQITIATTNRRLPFEKTVAFPTNACGRSCAEAVLQCGTVPADTAAPALSPAAASPAKRNCAAEYSACMAGCRGRPG